MESLYVRDVDAADNSLYFLLDGNGIEDFFLADAPRCGLGAVAYDMSVKPLFSFERMSILMWQSERNS